MASKSANRNFSLLIKPASADCNLRCEYCFYLDRSSLYPETNKHRMSDEVLETLIRSYLNTRQAAYSFGWQGGEPTLMGLPFFQKVTELQEKYGRKGSIISNGLQTNATLIDDEMARYLARYKFLVGVSLDGPEDIHNRYRKKAGGGGTYNSVVKGLETLKRNNVEFNVLVLVTAANVEKPQAVYNHLTELGIFYHQYIPCVEFDEHGKPLPWTISGEQWGTFLTTIFNVWQSRGDVRKISIRNFDAVLQLLVTKQVVMCTMGRNCTQYFVVEHNGDIYPCDFFVQKDLFLGNISTSSWNELKTNRIYKSFGRKKSEMNPLCSDCDYLRFCAGDCLKHRIYPGSDHKQLSWLCEGWKRFYRDTLPEFNNLAELIRSERK